MSDWSKPRNDGLCWRTERGNEYVEYYPEPDLVTVGSDDAEDDGAEHTADREVIESLWAAEAERAAAAPAGEEPK